MKSAVIFDLDGCIADDSHRRHLLPEEPAHNGDYDSYHERMDLDPAINVQHVLGWAEMDEAPEIIFLTARPEKFRRETIRWLCKVFGVKNKFSLIMREADDFRSSVVMKPEKLKKLMDQCAVIAAFDDRTDVVEAYRDLGITAWRLDTNGLETRTPSGRVPGILRDMARTFEERNSVYGDNYKMVSAIAKILFPDGIPAHILHSDQWHLFELKLVKLSRFAISGLKHKDSIHDDAVYSAMIEAIISDQENCDGK